MKKLTSLFMVLAFTVASCAPQGQDGNYNKQQMGTVLGGLGGGLAGSQFGKGKGNTAAVIGGTLLGAMVGNSVGQSLDRADMAYLNSSTQNSLEGTSTGTVSRWINPDSGNSGTVTPTRTFQNSAGQFCREYTQTIVVGGEKQNAMGTACRQPDGSWKIAN